MAQRRALSRRHGRKGRERSSSLGRMCGRLLRTRALPSGISAAWAVAGTRPAAPAFRNLLGAAPQHGTGDVFFASGAQFVQRAGGAVLRGAGRGPLVNGRKLGFASAGANLSRSVSAAALAGSGANASALPCFSAAA